MQALTEIPRATDVLAAMITPALLISASGTLVLSTSNRLSRVVDRVRVLSRDAEHSLEKADGDHTAQKRALLQSQLRGLAQRALILRSALEALYVAIGLLVATSIGAGIFVALRWGASWMPAALGMVGACALLWGSVLLVREARLAIGQTFEEMQYIRSVTGLDR
jgi:hypothetical protein